MCIIILVVISIEKGNNTQFRNNIEEIVCLLLNMYVLLLSNTYCSGYTQQTIGHFFFVIVWHLCECIFVALYQIFGLLYKKPLHSHNPLYNNSTSSSIRFLSHYLTCSLDRWFNSNTFVYYLFTCTPYAFIWYTKLQVLVHFMSGDCVSHRKACANYSVAFYKNVKRKQWMTYRVLMIPSIV